MAKKKATRKPAASRRKRRSADEMIADLQARIEDVKERAAAKRAKESPAMKRTITIMRSMNKAMDEAGQEKNAALRHALADSYKSLAGCLESQGLRAPRPRLPRGRRPKASPG